MIYVNSTIYTYTDTYSPYGNRCQHLHDPFIMHGNGEDEEKHCTKATKDDSRVDRLYHHKVISVKQTNPLISPVVLDKRLSSDDNESMAFELTCQLVCNQNVDIFPSTDTDVAKVMSTSTIKAAALNEVQKLCIVLQMYDTNEKKMRDMGNTHCDYVYTPTCVMYGQQCMVLQTRYFRLLPVDGQPFISMSDIAAEVTVLEYRAGKMGCSPETFVCAHEVVFAEMGKMQSNHIM